MNKRFYVNWIGGEKYDELSYITRLYFEDCAARLNANDKGDETMQRVADAMTAELQDFVLPDDVTEDNEFEILDDRFYESMCKCGEAHGMKSR